MPALWCMVKSRPWRLPAGQSSFLHRDGVEKTGSARDRVSATFSLRPRKEGVPRAGCSCLSHGLRIVTTPPPAGCAVQYSHSQINA